MAQRVDEAGSPAAVEWDLKRLQARFVAARRGRDINVLSLEIGIHSSSLRHVEAGELPQIEAIFRVCSWLGTTADEFVR